MRFAVSLSPSPARGEGKTPSIRADPMAGSVISHAEAQTASNRKLMPESRRLLPLLPRRRRSGFYTIS